MFHLSVEAIQLYMMRQAGPLKSLCLWDVGGWRVGVEVRLWIPLHACVVDVAADDKRRITFLPRSCQKRGEVFVAVVVVVSQCGLVDPFSVAWLENGQVLFIWWDGNAGAGGEPKWCLDVCLVSQCHSAQLSGVLVECAHSSAFGLFFEALQVPERVSCLLDKGFNLAGHLLWAWSHDPCRKRPWTFLFFSSLPKHSNPLTSGFRPDGTIGNYANFLSFFFF